MIQDTWKKMSPAQLHVQETFINF